MDWQNRRGAASSDAGKDTAAKRSRKRRREPTVKIKEKKKTGSKGKGGEGQRCSILPKCPTGNGTATEQVFNGYPLKTR